MCIDEGIIIGRRSWRKGMRDAMFSGLAVQCCLRTASWYPESNTLHRFQIEHQNKSPSRVCCAKPGLPSKRIG